MFVIGGHTAPAGARRHFGALLVGAWEGGRSRYVGKVGTGFTERTRDGKLRHSTFLGVRDDKSAREVRWSRPPMGTHSPCV